MYNYKKESIIILACIIIIIIFYIFYLIYLILKKLLKYLNNKELFSNDTKREKMKRIYKSNEVLDPDEIIVDNPYDDDCDDPDGNCGSDPDS